jgi:hypothetical protein
MLLRQLAVAASFVLGAALWAAPLSAQAGRWSTEQQAASWYGAFVDHAVTDRTALWFDGQWRRMGLVNEPQQLLLRPGIQRTIAPGVRVAAGYAYIATAPYGKTPLAAPLREHRTWQQLSLSHRAGALTVSHRYRWEQRWLASLNTTTDALDPFAYQHRARYMVRAQGDLPGVQLGGRPLLGFVWNEVLVPVGHGDATVRLTQNRLGGGVGIPLDARQRVEVGYMNLWNSVAAQRANEVNHTLTVSWVWIRGK